MPMGYMIISPMHEWRTSLSLLEKLKFPFIGINLRFHRKIGLLNLTTTQKLHASQLFLCRLGLHMIFLSRYTCTFLPNFVHVIIDKLTLFSLDGSKDTTVREAAKSHRKSLVASASK